MDSLFGRTPIAYPQKSNTEIELTRTTQFLLESMGLQSRPEPPSKRRKGCSCKK